VPRNFPGLHTVRGRDRLNYAFRVREMRAYLQHRFGSPTIRAASDRHQAVTNHRGIIVFDVRVWSDATGHIDLWDGLNIRHCAYFEEASEVLLWEIP